MYCILMPRFLKHCKSTTNCQFLSISNPLLYIFLTLMLLHLSLGRIWQQQTPNLPPGLWKLPIIGNLHQLAFHLPHHKLALLANKYGPIMHLQFGQISTVVVSSPETAKQVLKTHDILFAQRPFLIVADILLYKAANIVFAPCEHQWKQLRRICISELLAPKRVRFFRTIREEEVSKLIANISSSSRAGSPVNLSKMLPFLSCSIIVRTAFGDKCKDKDKEAFIPLSHQIINLFSGLTVSDLFPSFQLLHVISGIRYSVIRLHRKVDSVLENIINQHRISRADGGGDDDEGEGLVHALLDRQENWNLEFPLTNDHVKAIILDMFLAGIDSSAAVVEWAMSEIIKNPRVMKKEQAEIRQVLNGQRKMEETSLETLNYLKLLIKETMRLHPVLPVLAPREGKEACQVNGYNIPADTRVLVNVWAIARHPNYWTEPEKFCPERFIDSPVDYKGSSFWYLPFGGGRRTCPTVELAVAQLLYYFDWELPNGKKN